jgi:membrane-associated phospholipid phosphatase
VFRTLAIVALLALCATALVFYLWPGLDLAVARWFFADGAFMAATPLGRAYRFFFYWLPPAVMALAVVGWALRARGVNVPGAGWITCRGLAFMAISLALGPGALVNLGLKDHWHRPRPVQVAEFGGTMEFRPYWRRDGACARNCSFVSGEASSAAWLIAPASLAPPPFRAPAMTAALVVAALTAIGRVAIGGHFTSDVLFAALLTLLLTLALRRLIVAPDKR